MKISEAIIDGLGANEALPEIYVRVNGATNKPGFYQEVLLTRPLNLFHFA